MVHNYAGGFTKPVQGAYLPVNLFILTQPQPQHDLTLFANGITLFVKLRSEILQLTRRRQLYPIYQDRKVNYGGSLRYNDSEHLAFWGLASLT